MKARLIAALTVAAIVLAACGEKKERIASSSHATQSLSLMLDWFPNADHVGLYQALADGDFTKAGLNVHVQTPSDPALPLKLVAAGKVDLAISYEPEVMLARDQGLPVTSVAAIVQRPLTSIVSLGKQHITSPAQLRGKRVGTAGIPYQHAYLTTILARAGVPTTSVKEINVGDNLVPAMISGRVDATLGAFWNVEAIELAQHGKHPNVIRMDTVGVPTCDELVLVVKTGTLTSHIDVIRRFVQALARGYDAVRADPAAATRNLVKANPGLVFKNQLAEVRATLPAFFPSDSSRPWGWQDPTQWSNYGQWMRDHKLITNPTASDGASANQVLAGQGS